MFKDTPYGPRPIPAFGIWQNGKLRRIDDALFLFAQRPDVYAGDDRLYYCGVPGRRGGGVCEVYFP